MRRLEGRRLLGTSATWILALTLHAADDLCAQILPHGFMAENAFPGATFQAPVQIVFLPDGRRFVAEKSGVIWAFHLDGTQLSPPFIDLSAEVHDIGDQGMLSIAIDPDFVQNRWVYMAYTVDTGDTNITSESDAFARVTRYRASVGDPILADLSTRQVLLGASWPEGIPSLHLSHTVGTLRFARDKSLLISAGDGAWLNLMDAGGNDPGAFGAGKTDPDEDLGAFRARTLNSLAGKILRVDKETGCGLPSNPYWDGDPMSDRSRVWLYGLRNPYRFCIRDGTGSVDPADGQPGVLYIGDVGWLDYEEVDIVSEGGLNMGWPCFEGAAAESSYQLVTETAAQNTNVLCSASPSAENPWAQSATAPQLWWHHDAPELSNPAGWTGNTVIGGVFYTGTKYPMAYQGSYFVGDYIDGWIRAVHVTADDSVTGWSDFLFGGLGPVDIECDPVSGDLYYISIWQKKIWRIRYASATDAAFPSLDEAGNLDLMSRPNPFNPTTTIQYQLPAAGPVLLSVHGIGGNLVRTLVETTLPAGPHAVQWDGRDDGGRSVSSGVYVYRLTSQQRLATRKVVLAR